MILKTPIVYKALQDDNLFKVFKNPIWFYVKSDEELSNFVKNFFNENQGQKVKYLEILEKDFANMKTIETPFGDIELPTEKAYSIPVIVRESQDGLPIVDDTVLPVLFINKQ